MITGNQQIQEEYNNYNDARFSTLSELLLFRALTQSNETAYTFLSNEGKETRSLTFGELNQLAVNCAEHLSLSAKPGDRAILMFSPGLDFIIAFFACLYAGVIGVPITPVSREKYKKSTVSIFQDAMPTTCLTTQKIQESVQPHFNRQFNGVKLLAIDCLDNTIPSLFEQRVNDIAFLQYTSGSMSNPKGVMVSHENLLSNSEMIKIALGNTSDSHYLSWLPLYHDMGLIYNVLQSVYLGSRCVLMSPTSFLQRPLLWLKSISRYNIEVAGAPNFAFDLCVERYKPEKVSDINLESWKVSPNGAEPVRYSTIRDFSDIFQAYGFNSRAFYPCYGMAEATLLISGGRRGDLPVFKKISKQSLQNNEIKNAYSEQDCQVLVGCGKSLVNEKIIIVNPKTNMSCAVEEIGEIWVEGANIAKGYWNNPGKTKSDFNAYTLDTNEGPYFRTGDLGFLDDNGELFIAGRLKDIIIIKGQNFYPQDIEKIVESSHEALQKNCCAAFSISINNSERLVIVQEVKRSHRKKLDVDDVVSTIRQAVIAEYALTAYKIVLIKTCTLPKTTSGKIKRAATKINLSDNLFEIWGENEINLS